MKLLIPVENLVNYKCRDLIPFECIHCKKEFGVTKNTALRAIKGTRPAKYCSQKCRGEAKTQNETTERQCGNCKKTLRVWLYEINKCQNSFCDSSCAATYNNTHKTHGYRRSKLELWLEGRLKEKFPNLEIHYCRKDTINSELDLYIPSLKIAFELNGIFHYEPIFGINKLKMIQNNDQRKFQACLEQSIELCIIDSSSLKYFKEINCKKYLDIIINIINTKLEPCEVVETS